MSINLVNIAILHSMGSLLDSSVSLLYKYCLILGLIVLIGTVIIVIIV